MRITLPSGTDASLVTVEAPSMGLVIAPDIWGLRGLFDDMVGRLAAEWAMSVCAVEPFPGRHLPMEIGPRAAAIPQIDDRDTLGDLEDAATATACERVGLIGFCMGGMQVLRSASLDRFVRLVAFYGMIRVPPAWQGPGQREPLSLLAAGHPERVLAVIGEVDPYTPPDDVAALEGAGVTTARYPAADHGFVHDPERDTHRVHDAADAWARCESWVRS